MRQVRGDLRGFGHRDRVWVAFSVSATVAGLCGQVETTSGKRGDRALRLDQRNTENPCTVSSYVSSIYPRTF
jgi:hypothetical protein